MSTPSPSGKSGEPSPRVLRFIRVMGHVCLLGTLAAWLLLYKYRGSPYDLTWKLVLAQFAGGRAGSAGLGLESGFSRYYLLFHICMHDFIIMLYVYPWFVTGYQHLAKIRYIGSYLAGLHALALRHKDRIAPYGAFGLMLFVLFPFWSTGPLVGCVVGYLIGLRTWITFSSVIVGNVLAAAIWIWAYNSLKSYSPRFALGLLITVFILAIIGSLWAKIRKRRQAKWDAIMQESHDRIHQAIQQEQDPESRSEEAD